MTTDPKPEKLPRGTYRDPRTAMVLYDFQFQGQRYRGSTSTRDLTKAAECVDKLRAGLYDEKRLGHAPEAAPVPTLDAALAAYYGEELAKHHDTAAAHTITAQRSLAKRLLKAFGAKTPITDALAAFDDWRKKAIAGGLSKRTVNNYLATLKAAANHVGQTAPAEANVDKENGLVDRARYLQPDEHRRLFDALVAEPVLRDFLVFLLDSGARRREALRVRWSDVLLERVIKGRARPSVILNGSKDRSVRKRRVPLSERSAAILRRMRARAVDEWVWHWDADTQAIRPAHGDAARACRGKITGDHVDPPGIYDAQSPRPAWTAMLKVNGEKLHLGTFKTRAEAIDARRAAERQHFAEATPEVPGLVSSWDRVMEAAKVVDFHVHDCRHDYASRLVQGGMHLKKVATLLGHTTTAMVDRVYGHLAPDDIDEAADVLDSASNAAAPLRFDAPAQAGLEEEFVVEGVA